MYIYVHIFLYSRRYLGRSVQCEIGFLTLAPFLHSTDRNQSLILIQITFLYRAAKNIKLPDWGKYATGILYLDKKTHLEAEKDFNALAESIGVNILHWRDVPTNADAIGSVARSSEPLTRQVFVTAAAEITGDELIRKVCDKNLH